MELKTALGVPLQVGPRVLRSTTRVRHCLDRVYKMLGEEHQACEAVRLMFQTGKVEPRYTRVIGGKGKCPVNWGAGKSGHISSKTMVWGKIYLPVISGVR